MSDSHHYEPAHPARRTALAPRPFRRFGWLSDAGGYSLAESMVVLVIIAIVLAIAIPNFVRISARDRVETAALDFERTVILARQKAIAKRRPYRVSINTYQGSYYVERQEGLTWVRDPNETFQLHDAVELDLLMGGNPANSVLLLEAQGTIASDDAPASVWFFNDRGDSATVQIVRTGRIRTRVD
ncbi:MAG: prepilin-type N-terminal cleavage/methylation domain-containing protein [Candidatus Eisenbacteria bacterium]|nr:prepilin-type N-terminal cleavage/methylation domain-containing protein [Candidatus Eisenbacteria bacterium]